MPRRARRAVALAAAAAALMAGGPSHVQGAPERPVVITGVISDVVDGDTVKVSSRGFETGVRLIGIDTPETRRPGTPVQCGGPEATARMRALLPPGTVVRVVSDPTQDLRDRYDRFLGYVHRPGLRVSVNFAMVLTGHAKVYVYDRSAPFRHAASYRRAERRARAARRGVWGPPCRGDTTRPAPRGP